VSESNDNETSKMRRAKRFATSSTAALTDVSDDRPNRRSHPPSHLSYLPFIASRFEDLLLYYTIDRCLENETSLLFPIPPLDAYGEPYEESRRTRAKIKRNATTSFLASRWSSIGM